MYIHMYVYMCRYSNINAYINRYIEIGRFSVNLLRVCNVYIGDTYLLMLYSNKPYIYK